MILRLLATVCLAALSLVAGTPAMAREPVPQGKSSPTAAALWFDAVSAPVPLTDPQANRLALETMHALQAGTTDAATFAFLPAETAPRVVILTWQAPASGRQTAVGAGAGLRAATLDALRLASAIPGGRRVSGLKLDIVQHVLANPEYRIREDGVPLPGLAGLAFSRASGFVFTPENLMTDGLFTPKRQLNVRRIGENLAAAQALDRLGKWQAISSFQGTQQVFLFEAQSYYTDGEAVSLLFRGHRVPGPLRPAVIAESAQRLVSFLVKHIRPEGGFACDLPGWQAGDSGVDPLAAQAEALLALLEWQALNPSDAQAEAINRLAKYVRAHLVPYPPDRGAACMAEDSAAALDANALAVMALLKYAAVTHTPVPSEQLAKLGRYLILQLQPDGSLVSDRSLPSGKARAADVLPASAQAEIALVRLYEQTARREYLDAAEQALGYLLQRYSVPDNAAALPLDGWLPAALNETFTFNRDRLLRDHAERLGVALLARQSVTPAFPDLLGTWDDIPNLADTARRATGLLALARLAKDTHADNVQAQYLAGAHLALMFLMAGQMDDATLVNTAAVPDCRGAFRDNLVRYDMSLATQAQALRALCAACRETDGAEGASLPLTDAMKRAVQNARGQVASFPRCLPPRWPPTVRQP